MSKHQERDYAESGSQVQPDVSDNASKYGVSFHIYADDTQIYITFDPKIQANIVSMLSRFFKCASVKFKAE